MCKNRKTSCIAIKVIPLFCVLVIALLFFLVWLKPEPNRAEGNDLQYYQDIDELAYSDSISFAQIFRFDWDTVYIQKSPRMHEDELSEALMFPCDIKPLEDWFGYPFRLFFIYKNKVVYDFLYDQVYLRFEPDDILLKRENAVFDVTRKSHFIILTLRSQND